MPPAPRLYLADDRAGRQPVLNATDIAKPIQERIEARAATLHQRWELLFANRLSVPGVQALRRRPFLPRRGR